MSHVATYQQQCDCGWLIPVPVHVVEHRADIYGDGSYRTTIVLRTDDTDWFAHQWTHEG